MNQPIADKTVRRWTMVLLAVAFTLRLSAAVYWHQQASADDHYFRLGDSHGYWVLAEHIARGEPYQYGSENARVFRAPVLPLLLSPFTLIRDSSRAVLAARVCGALLGTFSVWLLGWLAARLAGRTAMLVAMGIAAVLPSAIGMSILILSEMLFIPLMLACLLTWHATWRSTTTLRWIGYALMTGIVAGLATLTRPSWLLFMPFVVTMGLIFFPRRISQLQVAGLIALGMCFVMSPWWMRNYQVTGRFVLTTLQVGPSLYDSFHPGATGGSDEGMQFMREFERQQREADRAAVGPLESTFEWRLNRRSQQAAWHWIAENPGAAARLTIAKFRKTWSLWPDGGEVGSPLVRLGISAGTLGIMLLAIVGSLCRRRPVCGIHAKEIAQPNASALGSIIQDRLLLAMCWAPCLYFTLLHMVFVGSVRYREPAVLVLVVVAATAVVCFFSRNCSTIQASASVDTGSTD